MSKIGVKDSILPKSGRLTEDEFKEMKNHTIYGEQSLKVGIDELVLL